MTLTKNKMVSEIGRHTRLKNRDVQAMLEALVEVWTEELISGGRIELENFIVLEVKEIDRGNNSELVFEGRKNLMPRRIRRVVVRASKTLKKSIQI